VREGQAQSREPCAEATGFYAIKRPPLPERTVPPHRGDTDAGPLAAAFVEGCTVAER
jgi:hypothetical protein